MSHRQKFKTALKRRNIDACRVLYEKYSKVEGWGYKLVIDLRESAALLAQRPDPTISESISKLIELFRSWMHEQPEQVREDFETHVTQADLFSRLFQNVLDAMDSVALRELDAREQAWGLIAKVYEEMAEVELKFHEHLNKVSKRDGFLDIRALGLEFEDGGIVTPNSIHATLVRSASMTLLMLAHNNKWFDRDGIANLPHPINVSSEKLFKVGLHIYFSSVWSRVFDAWDRSRFFGLKLIEGRNQFGFCGDVFTCDELPEDERVDFISMMRLEQLYLQYQRYLGSQGACERSVADGSGRISLPPHMFISNDEQTAFRLLDEVYCLPVRDHNHLINGLSLAGWLRAYAVLAHIVDEEGGAEPLIVNEDELCSRFCEFGLSSSMARKFIEMSLFQKESRDLFDTPLLRSEDGVLRFFTAAYRGVMLTAVVLSRLSSARTESDPIIDFSDKGKTFEGKVMELFKRHDIEVRSFPYSIGGQQWQCDVVALLGGTFFVFECKNYSIPMGRISSLYYFLKKLKESRSQAERIANQFRENPGILERHFGKIAHGKRIVPVVLHSLPWALETKEGACIFDFSALSRLFDSGRFTFGFMGKSGRNPQGEISLWKKNEPNDEELLAHLRRPLQNEIYAKYLEFRLLPAQLSSGSTLVTQTLISVAPREGESLFSEFIKSRKVFESIFAQSVRKVRRNELCPCGSKKKYKNCCGR